MMVEEKRHLGRYQLLAEIGRGAMGRVYKARDPIIDRVLAIKTVDFRALGANEPEVQTRFFQEAQSAGRLSHPNIVTIYDAGKAEGRAYIAMELLDGPSLRETLDQHAPLPLVRSLEIAGQVARGLAYAHEHGVIHRDVKPANVILVGRRAKITDFGIARLPFNTTISGELVGSPKYMSPEQARGDSVDGRSDLFSLGAILYEMLSGKPAFEGKGAVEIMRAVNVHQPKPLTVLNPKIPSQVQEVVDRLLAKEPSDRYPSARALLRDLAGLLRAYGSGGANTGSSRRRTRADTEGEATVVLPRPSRQSAGRKPFAWIAPAAALIGVLTLSALFWPDGPTQTAAQAQPEEIRVAEAHSPPASAPLPAPLVETRVNSDSGAAGATPQQPQPASVPLTATAAAKAPRPSRKAPLPTQVAIADPAANAPAPGTIAIAVAPWGEVYVDGESRGVSPPLNQVSVPPGKHRIEIRNGNLPAHTVDVNVASGDTRRIKHRFE